MNLVEVVDDLKGIDKIRLAIHIFEDLGFTTDYDIDSFIKLLKGILEIIDPNSSKE